MIASLLRFRIYALTMFSAAIMAGCYAFVSDETPPEWTGPAEDAQQALLAAGAGGPGAPVYNAKCIVCHQANGQGIPGVYPSLAGSGFATGDPVLPIKIVLHGFQGPIERNGRPYNGIMQPWQNDLTDQQIADVLTFIRKSWGNTAPPVEPDLVKKVREATKNKIGAFTESELKQAPKLPS